MEEQVESETFARLTRLYILADYLGCGSVMDLVYNKLLHPQDRTADFSASLVDAKAVSLAWEWLPSTYQLRDDIMARWSKYYTAQFDSADRDLSQDFVDDMLLRLYQDGD